MAPLTVRAAAARLGVSYSALKQWIYKGTVRTVRTGGGHHRVPEGEVDRMLAAQGKLPRTRARRPRTTGLLVSISGRNQLRGIVEEVRAEGLLAQRKSLLTELVKLDDEMLETLVAIRGAQS